MIKEPLWDLVGKAFTEKLTESQCKDGFVRFWIMNELQLEDDIVYLVSNSEPALTISRTHSFSPLSKSAQVSWKGTLLFNFLMTLNYKMAISKCVKGKGGNFQTISTREFYSSAHFVCGPHKQVEGKGYELAFPQIYFCPIESGIIGEQVGSAEYLGIEIFIIENECCIFEGALSGQLMDKMSDVEKIQICGPNKLGDGEIALKHFDNLNICHLEWISINWQDIVSAALSQR